MTIMYTGLALIAAAWVCLGVAGYLLMQIKLDVNAYAPPSDKVDSIWWTPMTYMRLQESHAQYLPSSGLRKKQRLWAIVGFVLFYCGGIFLFVSFSMQTP